MKTKLVRKVCALLLIIGLLFPLLGQSVQAYGDKIEPVYTTDDTGTYPAASWKPTGQENVINHQGGTISGWDNNTSWSGDLSDTTNSYIKHGNANDPDFAIRKFARETATPGTFDVFLNVRGNSVRQEKMLDVVFVVDTSGSMANDSRLASAKTGIRSFIEDVEAAGLGNNVRAGLVSYSGESHVQVALNTVSNNGASLKSKVSSLRANGGTFTQAGLHDAYEMLKNSNSDEKQIILLTDGEPTYSYRVTSAIQDGKTVYGTNFDYGIRDGAGNSERLLRPYNVNNLRIGATWPATLGEARLIKNNSNISIRALGINITGAGQNYNMGLLASPGHYKGVKSPEDIQVYLNEQTKDIINSFATIRKGKVTVSLGKQYEYVSKDATISVGTEIVDTSTMEAEFKDSMLVWSGLDLGKDQEVQLHYQVRLKTGTADFVPNKWYPMSGETVLTAEEIPGARFGIPSGKAPGTTIDVTKEWKTFSQTELPENISFKVIREVAGDDEW